MFSKPSDGQPEHALVMELLAGKVARRFRLEEQQPLPTARVVSIAAQVCDALAAVHAAGFIDRDLKPENVFLVQRDSNPDFVKLVDFGLVKAMRPDIDWARATVDGTFLGSPAYASPEQAAGSAVDWRTDIYALGIMLYELVTGVLPFDGQSRPTCCESRSARRHRGFRLTTWRPTSGALSTRSSMRLRKDPTGQLCPPSSSR